MKLEWKQEHSFRWARSAAVPTTQASVTYEVRRRSAGVWDVMETLNNGTFIRGQKATCGNLTVAMQIAQGWEDQYAVNVAAGRIYWQNGEEKP